MFGFGGSKPKDEPKSTGVYKEEDVSSQFSRRVDSDSINTSQKVDLSNLTSGFGSTQLEGKTAPTREREFGGSTAVSP
jgi:hypothetical protein